MGASIRYMPLNRGADAPEAVETSTLPEVVPGQPPVLERRSSLLQPEPVQPEQYYTDKQQHGNYYSGDVESASPPYTDGSKASFINGEGLENATVGQEVRPQRRGRRYCGMRKAVFIALIVVIALVIIIGAVLGGVLGTLLPRKSSSSSQPAGPSASGLNSTSSNTPLQAMTDTGLATTLSADNSGRLLSYYQDQDGRIIENSYLDGSWSLDDRSKINDSIVTDQATPSSPIAAISYPNNGQMYRQVFFISSTGAIMTTNSTQTTGTIATSWSAPSPITTDTVAPNSIGLAACWSDKLMNGIRVYYPSQYGYIQEVGRAFNESIWHMWNEFDGSDVNSGVACAVYNDQSDQYINVYMRNQSTNAVQQNWYDFTETSEGWDSQDGPTSWNNQSMLKGSDIAVCNDEEQTEYIFYQLSTGMVTRGIVNPSGSTYEDYETMQAASNGSKLAAAFVEGGAALVFQNASSDSTMWMSDESRNGVELSNLAIP